MPCVNGVSVSPRQDFAEALKVACSYLLEYYKFHVMRQLCHTLFYIIILCRTHFTTVDSPHYPSTLFVIYSVYIYIGLNAFRYILQNFMHFLDISHLNT